MIYLKAVLLRYLRKTVVLVYVVRNKREIVVVTSLKIFQTCLVCTILPSAARAHIVITPSLEGVLLTYRTQVVIVDTHVLIIAQAYPIEIRGGR